MKHTKNHHPKRTKELTGSFQKELDKLAAANKRYKDQLKRVEDQIKSVFGFYPSEVDCDSFIDSFHVGVGRMTVEELNAEMKGRISKTND